MPSRYLTSHMSPLSKQPLTPGTMLKSDSGQMYRIEEVLAERSNPFCCVYRATYNDQEPLEALTPLAKSVVVPMEGISHPKT